MRERRDVLCHHGFGILLARSRRAEAEQHFGHGSRKIRRTPGGKRRLQFIEANLQQRPQLRIRRVGEDASSFTIDVIGQQAIQRIGQRSIRQERLCIDGGC
jgi:hypothetical protein